MTTLLLIGFAIGIILAWLIEQIGEKTMVTKTIQEPKYRTECDRCGEEIRSYRIDPNASQFRIQVAGKPGPEMPIDLCGECTNNFHKWLNYE